MEARAPIRRLLFTASTLLLCAASAGGQETRAELIAEQQARKARELHAYQPGRVEQFIVDFRRRALEQRSGFFPVFGSVYSGGGFTLGAGYRRYFAPATSWQATGLWSLRNYKLVELSARSAHIDDGRLVLDAHAGYRDAPQVAFYGLGLDTRRSDRANYRLSEKYAGAAAEWTSRYLVVLGGAIDVDEFSLERGRGSSPSIEQRYSPATAPGLGASPTYIHSRVKAGLDWRDAPGYTVRGGLYEITLHDFDDRDGGTYSFRRGDLDLVQHIPIFRETWVLSLRGRVETTLGDGTVPYFLLPALGSASSLRGYPAWRFRDRHSLLTSAEWRWRPNRTALDMAVFYDAGKVVSRREDLDFSRLRSNWGIGARLHTTRATFARLELARGSEGWNIAFAATAAF